MRHMSRLFRANFSEQAHFRQLCIARYAPVGHLFGHTLGPFSHSLRGNVPFAIRGSAPTISGGRVPSS